MVIFNSYVKLPEGMFDSFLGFLKQIQGVYHQENVIEDGMEIHGNSPDNILWEFVSSLLWKMAY